MFLFFTDFFVASDVEWSVCLSQETQKKRLFRKLSENFSSKATKAGMKRTYVAVVAAINKQKQNNKLTTEVSTM